MTIELVITATALGVGLAMDAFSVSLANGLAEPDLNKGRTFGIASVYAGFQIAMPMIGWFLVTRVAEKFEAFRPFIPWIALVLLLMIGGGLLKDGIEEKRGKDASQGGACLDKDEPRTACHPERSVAESKDLDTHKHLGFAALMMQGVATSIDALSVGFTIADYGLLQAITSSLIIGMVTLIICIAGLRIGRRLGTLLAGRASMVGGIILIAIGLEIWIKGVFF